MRRASWILLVLALALVATGCRKKHSVEFAVLKAQYTGLVDRLADDAYADPEMQKVVAGLQAVSDKYVEYEEAQGLVAKIASETERAKAAREAAARAVAEAAQPPPAPPPPPTTDTAGSGAPVVPLELPNLDAVDAGVDAGVAPKVEEKPENGMALADFQQKFGSCFESPRGVALPGGISAQAMRVRDLTSCNSKYGSSEVSYYFVNGKWAGTMTETKPAPAPEPPKKAEPAKPPELVFPKAPESISIP